ncbi:MAG: cytochrome P450 [Acidobacteriota bacterium]
MTIKIRDGATMQQLRARQSEGDGVLRVSKGLAVLNPHWAQKANGENYADTVLPDRLVDLVRGRESPKISWKEIRSAWTGVLKTLGEPHHLADLEDRLRVLIDERLDREVDLPWAIQEIFTQALIPTVMAKLSPQEAARIRRDQHSKLTRLMRTEPREDTTLETMRSAVIQIRSGRVARRVIGQRAKGTRAREVDLADPIVDLLPTLGMDRAAHAVTSVLTAVAGPPGAVAVCMLLELTRRADWAERIHGELAAVSADDYRRAPARSAPITYRFVREVLRLWSSPLVLTRVVRTELCVKDEELEEGDLFHLSPYFAHRDPQEWRDPEVFDPDRWLPDSGRGPAHSCAYAPFGWAPTSCIGAGLGLNELLLLCRLLVTEYRIEAPDVDDVEVVMAAVPLPLGFRGTLIER